MEDDDHQRDDDVGVEDRACVATTPISHTWPLRHAAVALDGATSEVTVENVDVRAGSLADLERDGQLRTKVGSVPVVVFWHDGRAYAVEDRCPHMGFPLHEGSVESGLLTCHWHHARFDLASGCTLDPWADDARGYAVAVDDGSVVVSERFDPDPAGRVRARLRDGLEHGLTLVLAKAVPALLELGEAPGAIVGAALDFGLAMRGPGWGSGLTVLVAMANVLDDLDPADRPRALVHALRFVARDTMGHSPHFGPAPMGAGPEAATLGTWFRRFVETRSSDAAERSLVTLAGRPDGVADAEVALFDAATDHVFLDGGHTLDFANKACEALAHVGPEHAGDVFAALVAQMCGAHRAEEDSEWRHPVDLVDLASVTFDAMEDRRRGDDGSGLGTAGVANLGWSLLEDDPSTACEALVGGIAAGATDEELARAVALAAALRIVRFHTRNEFGDWDSVHHAFTYANAVHAATLRSPGPALRRGLVHGALRVHLDRFLNVPAARMPQRSGPVDLGDLDTCWDARGGVDDAGAIAAGWIRDGGARGALVAVLGRALLAEDAGFHWYQLYEAGTRQSVAWPDGSDEQAWILAAVARFLAAHTPTRRELPDVIRTADRLRRGEHLYED